MDNLLALAMCRRSRLWGHIAVGLYGRQGYLARVQIAYG